MGGLVVKQMLLQAGLDDKRAHFVDNTYGIVSFTLYRCIINLN